MVTVLNQFGIDITTDFEYRIDRDIAVKAFEACLNLWPEEIDVTEQEIDADGNGCYIPNLSQVWDDIEIQIENQKENIEGLYDENISTCHYLGVVNYSIFGILHGQARGNEVINLKNVRFEDVEKDIIRGHLGWKYQKPPEVNDDSIITIEWETGRIISIKNSEA